MSGRCANRGRRGQWLEANPVNSNSYHVTHCSGRGGVARQLLNLHRAVLPRSVLQKLEQRPVQVFFERLLLFFLFFFSCSCSFMHFFLFFFFFFFCYLMALRPALYVRVSSVSCRAPSQPSLAGAAPQLCGPARGDRPSGINKPKPDGHVLLSSSGARSAVKYLCICMYLSST